MKKKIILIIDTEGKGPLWGRVLFDNNLLIESGSKLSTILLSLNMVDKLIIFRSGKIIGTDERITPYEALQAITIWSAYQHYEEDKKGTLENGKLADLVILDENPLRVEPENIKDIQVLKTIKEGKIVFEK